MKEEDEIEFWRQSPPTESEDFMSSILKGVMNIFIGQIRLRNKVEEQTYRLDRIEEGLCHSQPAGSSSSAGPCRHRE